MSRKGVGTEMAAVILVGFTVAASGTLYLTAGSLVENQKENSQDYKLEKGLGNINVDGFIEQGNQYKIIVTNSGDSPNNVSFRQINSRLNSSVILPKETKTVDLGCLKASSDTVLLSSGGSSKTVTVEDQNIGGRAGVPEGYCVDIVGTTVVDETLEPYKIWRGRAYKNNLEETPYQNKKIELTIDGDTREELTDSNGEFTLSERWDTTYIESNSMWKKEIRYRDDTKTVDFHLGRGKFQPPNRVRLDYEDGQSRVYQTQEAFKERESNHINLTYDVIPQKVTDDEIEFKIDLNIYAKDGLKNDWDNNPDSKLLYQIPIKEGSGWGGPYAQVNSFECESGSSIDCRTGETEVSLTSSLEGQTLTWDSLPEDSGDKYMPLDHQVEASQNGFVGGLNPDLYLHHGGSEHDNSEFSHKYYRHSNSKRMIYIPEDERKTFYDNVTLNSLEGSIRSQFDKDGTLNTTYRSNDEIVTSALGWWTPPGVTTNNVVYSLENSPEYSSDTGSSSSIKNVMYEWNDVESGRTYDPNFTVTLNRHSDDRSFMLPVNLGTMGMFPENGGEALSVGERYGVYSNGMIRYPPYQQTGRFSFKTNIPGTDSSTRALVYKITEPGSGDAWTAKNYILNTGDQKIENIYLLNSQGQWEIFETTNDGDGRLDAGEEFQSLFSIEDNENKKVKINLQYQTISGASEPSYSGWPYEFDLSIAGETNYDFDISGDVSCNTRYCNSYRVGNSEEARPINNLRGNDASKSLFDEDLSSMNFYIKNNEDNSDTSSQRVKMFKFWIWLMQPYTDALKDELTRPEEIKVKTLENGDLDQGILELNFE